MLIVSLTKLDSENYFVKDLLCMDVMRAMSWKCKLDFLHSYGLTQSVGYQYTDKDVIYLHTEPYAY